MKRDRLAQIGQILNRDLRNRQYIIDFYRNIGAPRVVILENTILNVEEKIRRSVQCASLRPISPRRKH
jgi:hypothetical protein